MRPRSTPMPDQNLRHRVATGTWATQQIRAHPMKSPSTQGRPALRHRVKPSNSGRRCRWGSAKPDWTREPRHNTKHRPMAGNSNHGKQACTLETLQERIRAWLRTPGACSIPARSSLKLELESTQPPKEESMDCIRIVADLNLYS